jgi:hypothetical protein
MSIYFGSISEGKFFSLKSIVTNLRVKITLYRQASGRSKGEKWVVREEEENCEFLILNFELSHWGKEAVGKWCSG